MSTPEQPNDTQPDSSHQIESAGRREPRLHTPDLSCEMHKVADLSGSGMRLIFPKNQLPKVGQVEEYGFDDGQNTLSIKGCVKWVRKGSAFSRRGEVGVEFIDLSQGQREALVRLAVNGKLKDSRLGYVRVAQSDLYKVLGVTRYASDEQIDKAFDDRSKEWGGENAHHPQSAKRLDEICKAYAVLSDADKRAKYDTRYADQHDRAA